MPKNPKEIKQFLGAVSYLMVQSGLIDPSQGTSSGIKGVKKADKYVSKNDVVVELDGEEIQDVLNNPDFQNMITSGEFSKLASDPDFVKVLDNKDGIGILGDIYRSLEFNNGGKIDKGGNLDDDAIQSRGNMSGNRGTMSSNRSLNQANSEETYITGQRGNPANNDSGIAGPGGGSKKKPVGLVYLGIKIGNKISIKKYLFKNRGRSYIQKATVDKCLSFILSSLK